MTKQQITKKPQRPVLRLKLTPKLKPHRSPTDMTKHRLASKLHNKLLQVLNHILHLHQVQTTINQLDHLIKAEITMAVQIMVVLHILK
jgi:hypothetical protein